MTRIFHWFFYVKDGSRPCQALTSVLCLHYRPVTVHCSTKDAYTSEITFLALHPWLCGFQSINWEAIFFLYIYKYIYVCIFRHNLFKHDLSFSHYSSQFSTSFFNNSILTYKVVRCVSYHNERTPDRFASNFDCVNPVVSGYYFTLVVDL